MINKIISLIKEEYSKLNELLDLDIMRNPIPAPKLGSLYGQDVEPKGIYVLNGKTNVNGWVNGKASLNKPLYIQVNDNNQIEYKRELSKKYKSTGSRLTQKLMNDGYDGIITVYPDGGYGEIVLFPNSKYIFDAPIVQGSERGFPKP